MHIEISVGEIKVTNGKDNLIVSGIGSCLVITLYDSKQRIGALAHTILPAPPSSIITHQPRDTRYIDAAIDEMLSKMEAQGAKRNHIEAKLIGGANMFSAFTSTIGENNISYAKEKLKKLGIAIAGECVGGSQGRSVEFAVASGIVTVQTKL